MYWRRKWPSLQLITVLLSCLIWECASQWADDSLDRPFCGSRRVDQCCRQRMDDCSVPIMGTLCYCDEFCFDRRDNPDCCPDYRVVCLGEQPENNTKIQCTHEGYTYNPGDRLKINCNQCTCADLGGRGEIQCEMDPCLVDQNMIKRINNDYYGGRLMWQASNHSTFWGRKLSEGFQYKLGTLHSRRKVTSMSSLKIVPSRNLPRSFSSEAKWPNLIGQPEDQGWCAASWVYSTVGVASDRWAIMSKGKITEGLSFQHLLGCNNRNQKGCLGGHLTRAWAFIRRFGLVSRKCYQFTGSTTRCRLPKHRNATLAKCDASPNREPLYRVTPVYKIKGENSIKHEIYHNGPVQATMRVHKDLFYYSSGIYTCTMDRRGEKTGFHSIRITGWGEEYANGEHIPYWIAANSWGREWGEGGFFKIKRGSNECGIEDFVLGVWADTSKKPARDDSNLRSNAIDDEAKK